MNGTLLARPVALPDLPDDNASTASDCVMDERPASRSEPATFSDGPIEGLLVQDLVLWRDERGWLGELFRSDELNPRLHPAMAYVSETLPGVVRGPHEHIEQTDYFAFIGPGDFQRLSSGTAEWTRLPAVTGPEAAGGRIAAPRGRHPARRRARL